MPTTFGRCGDRRGGALPVNGTIEKRSLKNRLAVSLEIVFSSFALRKSVPTAMVVGTCLNAINQFPRFFHDKPLVWPKVCLNYLVPFLVSSWSILSVRLSKEDSAAGKKESPEEGVEEVPEDGAG